MNRGYGSFTTYSKKSGNFGWNVNGRLIWSSQTENFQTKRDFLKGSPKFPNGISKRKMCVHLHFSPFGLSVPVEMSVEMEHAHHMEISIRGFDASHSLQYSTNRFFRLNGKQPVHFVYSSLCVFLFFHQSLMKDFCKY